MSKIYVIAGKRSQAEVWIKSHLDKRYANGATTLSRSEYVIVDDIKYLLGIKDPHGFFIGTWKERKDIIDIVEEMYIRSGRRNIQLEQIRREIHETT